MITSLVSSIAGLAVLILLAAVLRHTGLLKRELAKTLAWLVTHVTLPALIVHALAGSHLVVRELGLALSMLGSELACLALAWLAAGALGLDRSHKGAFVLVSAFGSSALLGYALVTQVFPGSDAAMSDAVIISEVGVAPLLFVAGVWIAVFYGRPSGGGGSAGRASLAFLRSPVFGALVAGLLLSGLDLPASPVVNGVMDMLQVAGKANTLLVALTVGLLLDFSAVRDMIPAVAVSSGLKLVAEPLTALLLVSILGVSSQGRDVLLLQTAMPAATLAVVFSHQYGCDSRTASFALLVSTILSAATVPLLFILTG